MIGRSRGRLMRFIGVALLALAVSSCAWKKKVYPVHGQLFVDDQPAAGAIVELNPIGPARDAARPFGHVDAAGAFTLSTFANNDGAPPGEYVVTVQWRRRRSNPFEADGPDKLQGRYSQANTSTLKVRIEPKPNELEPFRLSTGAK